MVPTAKQPVQSSGSVLGFQKNLLSFLGSLIVALALTFFLRSPDFSDSQNYVMFLLFFSVALWLTEAIPPFAVALLIIAFLFFALGHTGLNDQPQNVAKYVQTFSSSVIWLMLGGFFLAEAMTKTGLDADLLKFSMKLSGNRPKSILMGLMGTAMVASMFLSNTATTSMVLASTMPLVKKLDKNPISKALVIGIPLAASIGGMGTIIGSPTNAIAIGALAKASLSVSFLSWMVVGIPIALLLTFVGWLALSKKYIKSNDPLSVEALVKNDEAVAPKQKSQRIVVIIIFVGAILLWLVGSNFGLTVSAVAAVPIVLLPIAGILKAADIRKLPWDTLILVAGGLSLGLALEEAGMLQYFTRSITDAGLSKLSLLLIFAFGTMIFSNVMSNTATSTILVPLGIYMMPNDAIQVAVVIGLCASTALLLPVSTPPNAIAYSTGVIKQKDFLLNGLIIGILGPLLVVALVALVM